MTDYLGRETDHAGGHFGERFGGGRVVAPVSLWGIVWKGGGGGLRGVAGFGPETTR